MAKLGVRTVSTSLSVAPTYLKPREKRITQSAPEPSTSRQILSEVPADGKTAHFDARRTSSTSGSKRPSTMATRSCPDFRAVHAASGKPHAMTARASRARTARFGTLLGSEVTARWHGESLARRHVYAINGRRAAAGSPSARSSRRDVTVETRPATPTTTSARGSPAASSSS